MLNWQLMLSGREEEGNAFLTHVYHPLTRRFFCRDGCSLFVGLPHPVRPCSYGISWVYTHMYTGMNGTVVAVAIILEWYRADTFVFPFDRAACCQNGGHYCSQLRGIFS